MKEFFLIDEFWIDFDFSIFKEYYNLLSYHYHKGDNHE